MNFKITFLLFVLVNMNIHYQTTNVADFVRIDSLVNVSTFVSNFADYAMNIQAAGLASIPKATISPKGALYIEYAYHSGGENRNGKMTLYDKGNHRFEGS
ncbi:MAG: hypothetical protein AAF806_27780 [Bacteroidota bacterium]